MRKRINAIVLLFLCILMIVPFSANATVYTIKGTDISINIDDTTWYVFTRDNLKNNSELDDLGVSYDYMYNTLYDNEAHIDAIVFYEDSDDYLELFLRVREVDDIVYLTKYSDSEVSELAEALAKKVGASECSTYKTQYKFTKMEYYQSGFYVMEYMTVVNGDSYTLTFQAESPFSNGQYREMDDIVDSIEFQVDSGLVNNSGSQMLEGLGAKFIEGAVLAGIVSVISLLLGKNKEKADEDGTSSIVNGQCFEEKPKKDRSGAKRTVAAILLVLQGLAVGGLFVGNNMEGFLAGGVGYLTGFCLPAIIAVFLFVSAHKEIKRLEAMEAKIARNNGTIQIKNEYAAPVKVTTDNRACYCKNCGAKLLANAKFCAGCGTKAMYE